jgi:hypothetical protein
MNAALAAGGLVAGIVGGIAGDLAGHSRIKIRGSTPLRRHVPATNFGVCMADAHHGPAPTMVLHSDNSFTLNGVPASCISEIETYNAQPNITAINAAHGTVTVLNSTAISVSGTPSHLTTYLESIATNIE